jgi:hypothetical protein
MTKAYFIYRSPYNALLLYFLGRPVIMTLGTIVMAGHIRNTEFARPIVSTLASVEGPSAKDDAALTVFIQHHPIALLSPVPPII